MKEKAKILLSHYFKNDDGEPFIVSDGQLDIFNLIYFKDNNRVQIIAPTQYGKSSIVAMSVIMRMFQYGDKFAIVTGQEPKSQIIMQKIIQHIFDCEQFISELDLDKNIQLDRLKRERSQKRITFRNGGEVRTYTADARNKNRVKDSLMGFGCIPKGYMVMTDFGEIEISELVKNKITDNILSYNHKTKKKEFQKIKEYQINEIAGRDLIEIEVGDEKIRCTEDHPVFVVGKGYVRAEELKKGDRCLGLSDIVMGNAIVKKIRRIKSKEKVYNLTVEKNKNYFINGFLLHNSPNIVEDESSLIPDDLQAMVLRMLGGYGGGFLVKIGNPSYRNHFFKTWNSNKYKKVFIDYIQGLKEGRYSEDFIEEMKDEPYFGILYECKFPEEDEIDLFGYRKLFTNVCKLKVCHKGDLILGFDVGEGGDENLGVLRSNSYAEVVHKSKISDLMATVSVIKELADKYKVKHGNIFIDRIGVGAGVYHRLVEIGLDVRGIKWSEKSEEEIYTNLKAENFMRSAKWKGTFSDDDGWNELDVIRFKEDSSGRFKIKGKDELRREGIKSPNVADAFALTFNKTVEENAPNVVVF